MAKRYRSVPEMTADLLGREAAASLEKRISETALGEALFVLRCAHGKTQAEMARAMRCTQGKVSKMEHSSTMSLRISDLVQYLSALDLDLALGFYPRMSAAENVKFHASQIRKHLAQMVAVAEDDPAIREGVRKFHDECLQALIGIVVESARRLTKAEQPPGKRLQIDSALALASGRPRCTCGS